ncbi:hypothetical protein IscW_ISCW009269 [Ixodes scapularis]|uniref:Uncharacterized protein n=1 Tax=Ixodes scapularis TaxID=6945 RepID=B7Q0Y6_IXOSC|nr:hypothetical protein IscW_ISCW009269 [Ixodes scapularis]|eukprot:XP_002408655.1 hypothetical protein IscW_ISCW009269 [Ixodes scapularis]
MWRSNALQSEPKLLTLWLLLELVERELELQHEMKPDVAFFVDPMPNLRYMVPAKRELEDCREELERFELQKRLQDYKDSVKGFLKYFQEDQRLVKVHVDQNPGPVSPQLVQLFTALGFLPRCALDPSFVFLPVVPATKNKRRCSRSSSSENEMVPHEWFQEEKPDKPGDTPQSRGCACLDTIRAPSQGNQGDSPSKVLQLSLRPSRPFFAVCWQGPQTPTVASADSSGLPDSEQNQMSSADKVGFVFKCDAVTI